jgi:hypothetical protein
MLLERQPHPVKDLATAVDNRRRVCEPRGYCGPFINREYYDAFPDPTWVGIGECLHCRSAVNCGREARKRALALCGFRYVRAIDVPLIRYPRKARRGRRPEGAARQAS